MFDNYIPPNLTMISYSNGLKVKIPSKISYIDLEKTLLKNYNLKRKKGLSYYEYFDLTKQDFKLFFDIDLKIDLEDNTFDDEIYIDNVLVIFKNILNITDEDIVISCDSREKEKYYKVSYHLIIQRKTNFKKLSVNIEKLKQFFKKNIEITIDDKKYPLEIDTSVYSNGLQKFRTIYSKKDGEKNSLLYPINHNDKLYQHLIQHTDDLEEFDYSNIHNVINKCLNSSVDSSIDLNYEETISNFSIFNTKDMGNCKIHTLNKGYECPFTKRVHKNNHCYLVDFEDTILLKCFDEECCNKVKVIYKNVNTDTLEFDLKVFNSIQIPKDKTNNYKEKRDYFEKFYKYFVDIDTFYRVRTNYNKKYDYYNTELVEIKRNGLNHLHYYKKDEEGKLKKESFIKEYTFDNDRTNLFNIIFDPLDINKNYYNLFDGFDFSKVLDKTDEITEDDVEDFNFLLKFIKKNVCESNDDYYDYFISHFSSIIQNPSFLNHIIMLFYSSKQGTGKSSFLKFISKVIGQKYSYFGSYEQVLEKHSTSSLGKFINIIEEVDFTKSKKFSEDMKNLSQREEGVYNGKGKVETKINTFVRYFLTSNKSNSISIPKNDRRYCIYEFQKIDDEDIINRLDSIYENKKIIYLFGNYLMNYDIKYKYRSEWIKNKPMTECYKLFIHNDSISLFLKDFINKDDFFQELYVLEEIKENIRNNVFRIKCKRLYDFYTDYCREDNLKPFSKVGFNKSIRSNYKYINDKTIKGYKYFEFKLEDLHEHFGSDNIINKYE